MDFGTTNSGMATYDGRQLRLIPLDPTNSNPAVAPTTLYITNDRSVFIGRQAVEMYYEQNLNRPFKMEKVWIGEIEQVFAELPRFIRDVYIDKDVYAPGRFFRSIKMGLPDSEYTGTIVGNFYFFLEDIIALYLYVTKTRAETYLNTPLESIVLGRPVRFSENATADLLARERLLQSAFRAGYKEVVLQYEPIAAAHYYETTLTHEENVLIFDFGGGTLDISILHLGNAKNRRVLANGGIAIAGDIFDQKIVRRKLPPHFGEGTTFRKDGRDLPVPDSYYEAFSNWQEMLRLQLPDRLEALKNIERFAQHPLKIHALINLIQGQYALKMFDAAETTKRRLSDHDRAVLSLSGKNFAVSDILSRTEFERIIRPEIQAIEKRLDEVLSMAGLPPAKIDAVIRTGGSSQIPAFIQMLEQRFGAAKVRDLDTFSSVTAGLGVLAHQIEAGELDVTVYRASDDRGYQQMRRTGEGVPLIDFDLLKQFIALRETPLNEDENHPIVLAQTTQHTLHAARYPTADYSQEIKFKDWHAQGLATLCTETDKVLLMTTDYRCFVRPARQLAEMTAVGTDIRDIEGFRSDKFSDEKITLLIAWADLIAKNSDWLVMLSTLGYGRLMEAGKLLSKLDSPIAYQLAESRGYPATLTPLQAHEYLVIITNAGRAVRLSFSQVSRLEERLMTVPLKQRIIAALPVLPQQEILIAFASGYAQRVKVADIPVAENLNTSGIKITTKAEPVSAHLYSPQDCLLAITTQRLIPVEIPTDEILSRLLKLRREEQLMRLVALPA
jgi:hypothetical chaperone protein